MSYDFYKTLRVSPRADAEAIKASYRQLARRLHPDVNHGFDATQRMIALNEAYEVLSDPGRRAAYDRERLVRSLELAESLVPHPYPPRPPVWETEPIPVPDDPGVLRTQRWRIVLRAVGTLFALIGIAVLLQSGMLFTAPEQPLDSPDVIEAAAQETAP